MGGLWKRGHVEAGDIVKCRDCKERKPAVARYEHWCRGCKITTAKTYRRMRAVTDHCGTVVETGVRL
jgi:hypothetical protein